jgi:maleamate amidohydrolase
VLWTIVRFAADMGDAGFFAAKVPALACFADGAPGEWGELALAPGPGEPVVAT